MRDSIAVPAPGDQARLGGGRWKSAESQVARGARPRDRMGVTACRVSGETSPMNKTGNIAINRPEMLFRKIEVACRWEPMFAKRIGTACAPAFWL